jgi:hypothetical protein
MSDPGNVRVVALFLGPLNRFSLRLERNQHVVGVVLYDKILDRAALRTALGPRFNVNVSHSRLLEILHCRAIQNGKSGSKIALIKINVARP